jgi:hypothetical protein
MSMLKPNIQQLIAFLRDVAITGFNHRLLSVNTPEFIVSVFPLHFIKLYRPIYIKLAFKLATTSQVAFDVIMTVAMSK